MANETSDVDLVDKAVAEGGAYDIIRRRLLEHSELLETKTVALNTAREAEFGSTKLAVSARTRVRTENNCIGRDIVQLGDVLLFGYNVFIGLKTTTQVEDVFALYRLSIDGDQYAMSPVPIADSFLDDRRFRDDFNELYRYYSETRLIQLVVKNNKLLAAFQIGDRLDDQRVFRWTVAEDGHVDEYIDNRGERDIELPKPYDFEWTSIQRDDVVHGRHPHVNILDELFVETLNGDLTVKIENNTDTGQGIYREPVDDDTQSLDDADIFFAKIGNLIVIKIRPYKETQWRHLVYNSLNTTILRIDAIGDSCVQLPEDHGIIFPGGYYLETGEHKSYDSDTIGLRYKRKIRSPNGEDVLFVFYEPVAGVVALLSYNLITKTLQNPIVSHGYALASDGTIVVFTADDEATRTHPMQLWESPYLSDEVAHAAPATHNFYSRTGNADLVRGVSALFSVCKEIRNDTVSAEHYENLQKALGKLFDKYDWIDDPDAGGIGSLVRDTSKTVELIVDEFEKVDSIRKQSAEAMREAANEQQSIVSAANAGDWKHIDDYVEVLDRIRHQRGHLATIAGYRYIDTDQIADMDKALVELNADVGEKTAVFLSGERALTSYADQIDRCATQFSEIETVAALDPTLAQLEHIGKGLDLLSELVATLNIDDATIRTRIVESISTVYATLNQTRARGRQRRDGLGSAEAVEQFGAQFKLFSQSTTNALELARTPESCEDQLSRLLVQLEEMESQFSEHDRFLTEIMQKREEIYDTFESHKQQLLDARQTRAQSIGEALSRMLDNIAKRSRRFSDDDELNTYLATDALVLKVHDMVEQLRELDSAVKADDAQARLKMIQDQALRELRDKSDLYEDGGKTIQLGPRHKFSVNTEDLDLTIIPRGDGLALHLIGTQYYETIDNPVLNDLKDFWHITLESESPSVYRGEYLADSIIQAASNGSESFSWRDLKDAVSHKDQLEQLVRDFVTPRYRDGYTKGVHDADAAQLLTALVPVIDRGELLRFDPASRGFAQVFWTYCIKHASTREVTSSPGDEPGLADPAAITARARSAARMSAIYGQRSAVNLVVEEVTRAMTAFTEAHPIETATLTCAQAAAYLVAELGNDKAGFIRSQQAKDLQTQFQHSLSSSVFKELVATLGGLSERPAEQWNMAHAWLDAFLQSEPDTHLAHYVSEVVAQLITDDGIDRRELNVNTEVVVTDLFGDHPTISDASLSLVLDQFLSRLEHHRTRVVPGYRQYQALRHEIAVNARETLRLDEFKARPLSSFVRNQLINDAYLPIMGDNLAKQIGTIGDSKRSDLSGLLMMISPPGYGKTTLMEYVASRLGLTFMKINCPSLGSDVDSLDPASAPNATARQELEKLNLAFEMGDNVMLYLDDIQHTGGEFLQRFISLCDSTRRVEGIWKGRTRTYDLRGRKFCVVMAGNPYTESGESFKVPDMLANRADIYNLGDVLSGKEKQFALSYIENCLTSNAVLAPLATRDMQDVYKLFDRAQGRDVATTDLSHAYSGAEVEEITRVLQRLFQVQDTVLKVNQQYIASAAQDDRYRTEPPFLLQGSYRNMNKLAEKVSAVMNDDELNALIDDHYRGEAQLLTQGAEANLLKLAALRDTLDESSVDRWQAIKEDFQRQKALGGDDADSGQRIAIQLSDLVEGVNTLGTALTKTDTADAVRTQSAESAKLIGNSLDRLGEAVKNQQANLSVVNTPSQEFAQVLKTLNDTIENTLFPLVRSMDNRIAQDLEAHDQLRRLSDDVSELKRRYG